MNRKVIYTVALLAMSMLGSSAATYAQQKPKISKYIRLQWETARPHPVEMHVPIKRKGAPYYFTSESGPSTYRPLLRPQPHKNWNDALNRATKEIQRRNEEMQKSFR